MVIIDNTIVKIVVFDTNYYYVEDDIVVGNDDGSVLIMTISNTAWNYPQILIHIRLPMIKLLAGDYLIHLIYYYY